MAFVWSLSVLEWTSLSRSILEGFKLSVLVGTFIRARESLEPNGVLQRDVATMFPRVSLGYDTSNIIIPTPWHP